MKILFSIFAVVYFTQVFVLEIANAQLTGIKNIPGNYATLANAISDLNLQGVGVGGVLLNLLPNNPEIAPFGGYSILNITGSPTNQIIIEGNSNTITAFSPQSSGVLNDAIFKIIGSDYVTIRNFTIRENPSNTITNAATNNMTEWGIALLYASTTNGAQNVRIQGNTISLNRTYQNTFGIYSNVRHNQTQVTVPADITAYSGSNSNLQIYANNISNVNLGIVVVGSATGDYMDANLDIGGSSSMTGNDITNYGTTSIFSNYVSVNPSVAGILANNCINLNISFNNISSSVGGTTSGTLRGIYTHATGTLPTTGSILNRINNNIISIKSGAPNGDMVSLHNAVGNSITSFNINNNDFNNTYVTVIPTENIFFIYNEAAALNMNINNNTFTNLNLNNQNSSFFDSVCLIINHGELFPGGIKNVNYNSVVTQCISNEAQNLFYVYCDNGPVGAGSITNNNYNNITNIFITERSKIRGWSNTGQGMATKNFEGNYFNNWTTGLCGGGSCDHFILDINNGSIVNVTGNSFCNLLGAGNASIKVLSLGANIQTANVSENLFVHNYNNGQGETNVSINSESQNLNVFRNKIVDMLNFHSNGQVRGIKIPSTINAIVYNNLIGDLKTPFATSGNIIGLHFSSSGGMLRAYYNTIHLNAKSNINGSFSSAAISTSTASVDLRNNIFVNNSVTNAGVKTIAYLRSSANLSNYDSSSNNNLFYAGIPSPDNLIFYDGSNSDQTLEQFRARVYPRDSASITENPPFSSNDILHIDPTILTYAESAGSSIAGFDFDYDDDFRQGSTGYVGDGLATDLGADEFEGIIILNDVGVTSVSRQPEGTLYTGYPVCFNALIKNFGRVSQSSIPVNYRVNGGTQVGPVNTSGTLVRDSIKTVSFCGTESFTPPIAGTYSVKLYTALSSDTTLINDTAILIFDVVVPAPLTGTKNIPGDYNTLNDAVIDLNGQGVGIGGVTLNLLPGNPQTAPAGGYIISSQTGSSTNSITIEGNGNTITAFSPQTAGALNDAVFKIIGEDYTTIRNFVLQENPLNIITTAATNNMTEWGVAVLYVSPTNGSQNVRIENNTISLNRIYPNTFGIYSNVRHSNPNVITPADINDFSGSNSNLKIYNNNISNVNNGIAVIGSLSGDYMDMGLDIGGNNNSTGNTLTNYGTVGTFSPYVSVSPSVNGILVNNQRNHNISYNSIVSSIGGIASGALRGIYIQATGTLPLSSAIINNINHNTISIKSGASSGAMIGIANEFGNSVTSFSINKNDFNSTRHTVNTTGDITFISNTAGALNVTIDSNTFTNDSVNTNGVITFIHNNVTLPAGGTKNVNSNSIVTGFKSTGSGADIQIYFDDGDSPSGTTANNNNNNFSNISASGHQTQMFGWKNHDGGQMVKNIQGNVFNNWVGTNCEGGGCSYKFLDINFGSLINITGNNFSNFSGQQAAVITAISLGSNVIKANIVDNTISTVVSSEEVNGIVTSSSNCSIIRNKIYDLRSYHVSKSVNGIKRENSDTITIINNHIGDLQTPVATSGEINGIRLAGGGIGKIYYNTVYLFASSINNGSFNSYSISGGNSVTDIRNNIFVNNSIPNSSGSKTVALRWSDLSKYDSTCNNNLFYAGTPNSNRLIFYDGTNSDSTLAQFKARVAPRDSASITENPDFLSVIGSSSDFLHIDPSTTTDIESGGKNITGITGDYDNQIRQGNPGYTGSGSAPDIGADEFEGTTLYKLNLKVLLEGVQSYVPVANQLRMDTVSVFFRKTSSPYELVDSAKAFLDSSGSGLFSFANIENGVNYYLTIKHRNSIETWSANGQDFIEGIMNYDFTTSQSQAFGRNPMVQYGSRFYICSADIDQNGTVDMTDILPVYNDLSNFILGSYILTDLNYDGIVDLSDLIYAFNNSFSFVSTQIPR